VGFAGQTVGGVRCQSMGRVRRHQGGGREGLRTGVNLPALRTLRRSSGEMTEGRTLDTRAVWCYGSNLVGLQWAVKVRLLLPRLLVRGRSAFGPRAADARGQRWQRGRVGCALRFNMEQARQQ